jgi:hypothetical protein
MENKSTIGIRAWKKIQRGTQVQEMGIQRKRNGNEVEDQKYCSTSTLLCVKRIN